MPEIKPWAGFEPLTPGLVEAVLTTELLLLVTPSSRGAVEDAR